MEHLPVPESCSLWGLHEPPVLPILMEARNELQGDTMRTVNRIVAGERMEQDQPVKGSVIGSVEYVSTSVPANFVVVRAPKESEEVGGVRPGDLVVVDQESSGTDGATVVFHYEQRPLFGECVVKDGVWYVRDASGTLRPASEMIHDGAVYRGTVRHVVRPNGRENVE